MTPYHFFMKHAGYSYGPEETREEGRRRCARELAAAERWGSDQGLSFHWEYDMDTDSSDWSDDPDPYRVWQLIVCDRSGNNLTWLGGVDFGRDGGPWSDPYRRVCEAVLALSCMEEARVALR